MKISLWAMLPACGGLYLLNHSAAMTDAERWAIGAATALVVMVESGFTPAALAWLAQSLGRSAGKGAAMMAERAGEAITEIGLAMQNEIDLKELASTVHPYPTYNSGIQMLATQMVLETAFSGMRGSVLQMLARRGW